MKVKLIVIGKTDNKYMVDAIANYIDRLKHYADFDFHLIADIKNSKNLSEAQVKEKEGQLIKAIIKPADDIILLDELGTQYSSVQFSKMLEKKALNSTRTLVFIIGGAYGFSPTIYELAGAKMALSTMTFTHQMVRLFFVEQLYRAFTIIKGESYHHM